MLRIVLVLALAVSAHAQVASSNAQLFLQGLEQMNAANRNPSLFLEADGLMTTNELIRYVEFLKTNPVATQNARALTLSLRQSGAIAPNEEIVGVSDGRAIKSRTDLIVTER